MPISAGFGGMVFALIIIIIILTIIIIKTRKNILSRKLDTRHYTKPPAGNGKYLSLHNAFAQYTH